MPRDAYLPILMLLGSNVFMTLAWYGHLRFKAAPIVAVALVRWGVASFEYWLAVPANRIGHGYYLAAQLRTIQEIVPLLVFAAFSVLYLGEPIRWNHAAGFVCLAGAAFFLFGW